MPPSVRGIIETVAAEHRVRVCDMLSRRQTSALAKARWDAMARIRASLCICGKPPSLPQIGRWFDRDHSTVLHGLRKITA